MLKRNKLSIFLLAVVMMLTVYYIKSPTNNEENDFDNQEELVDAKPRYAPFSETRNAILETRSELLSQLEVILGSTTVNITEKELALQTMQEVTSITERELSLEQQIMGMGYDDALVHVTQKQIKINILTEVFSVEEFIEIALTAKTQFDRTYTVSIEITGPTTT